MLSQSHKLIFAESRAPSAYFKSGFKFRAWSKAESASPKRLSWRTHADHLRALNVQARNKKDRTRRKARSHIDAELDDYDDGLWANVANPLEVGDGKGVMFNHSESITYDKSAIIV